jgi:hypothetical protein
MKTKLIALMLFVSSAVTGQSTIDFQTGTSIYVQTGASVCADSVIMNGTFTGGGTICGLVYSLDLTAFIEGLYDFQSGQMVSDTVTIYLRDTVTPFTVVDFDKVILNSAGHGTFHFPNAMNGKKYYLVLAHRNSVGTWSFITPVFAGGLLNFDFTSAITQAYGNNMKQINSSPVRFAIFSGDVNQDGTVDATDVSAIDNDAYNFLGGYVATDLTGDNFVDGTDFAIADNNAANFVSVIRP